MNMKKIASIIKRSHSIAIVVHLNPDADCIGSATALLEALRSMGKKADIFCDGDVPNRLSFLVEEGYISTQYAPYDVCVAVDVAEKSMMGDMEDKVYNISSRKCCIDHHATNKGYTDCNYVDANAAATGEIMYYFIKDCLKTEITESIAMRLYAAIASDTGSFKYSNTTPRTHKTASEIMSVGFDAPRVMRILFEQKTAQQLKLNAEVTSKLRFYMEDRVCIAVVDEQMLSKYSLAFGEADDIATIPRSIVGVEVGVYIKVKGENECKVSLRSNEYVDVSAIAKSLGGGGHVRAAGVTINDSIENTEKIILDLIKKVI